MSSEPEPWTANAHYRRVILEAVPDGCERALDVGCGTGALTRELRGIVPGVVGIDQDKRSLELARAHPAAGDIEYLLGDFLTFPFQPASFDLITSVASLHHMDARAALVRTRDLLRPRWAVAVIGLARSSSPLDLALHGAAVIGRTILRRPHGTGQHGTAAMGQHGSYDPPIVWPPRATYTQMRELSEAVLPGVRYRRHVFWRYSLVWVKPQDRGAAPAGGSR
ncbi:MAG: class I SAM-dependent methyltransferase [Chloroflexota bacterium]|nr:class I SAM-dependent methyltransferase [Chloroflexota bacterium]